MISTTLRMSATKPDEDQIGVDPQYWIPNPGRSSGERDPRWVVPRSIPRSSGVERSRALLR